MPAPRAAPMSSARRRGLREMRSDRSTYVLVPGAGGDSFYWSYVGARLRERGHEARTPDLPAADDRAGLAEYADAVVAAIDGHDAVTLVAQSMGAYPASMACERADVAQLVLVAPMIPAPGETPGAWWANSGQEAAARELDAREGRDPDAPFDVATTFLHDIPPEVVAALLARGEPRQADTPFADPWPLDAWPSVPTRVLAARHDRLFPLAFIRRLASERLGLDVDAIDGGHLVALSRPDDLARRLEESAALIDSAP